jgi:hypothetical protein
MPIAPTIAAHRAQPLGSETVGHTGVDAMTGGRGFLAVGLLVGAAIAWALPGLAAQLMPAARAAPRAEKPAGEPDPGAGPKNDQPSLVKLDADDAARVLDDGAGDGDGEERGCGRPGKPRSQNSFWGRIAMVSWADFFESKGFGACFGGLVSVLTLQMAGADARSTFALTLLIVVGYWLALLRWRLRAAQPGADE